MRKDILIWTAIWLTGFLLVVLLSNSAVAQTETPELPDNGPTAPQESEPGGPTDNTNEQGDLNQNNQNSTVDSFNRSTTNVGAGAGSPTPVSTAIAPSLLSSGSETCLQSSSSGAQLVGIGYSKGTYKQDEECNRRRDAKVFKDLGMTIAAVSRMCQNDLNWKAMFLSGTPCPILVNGRMVFGKNAVLAMRSNPDLYIPDYKKESDYYDQVLGLLGGDNEAQADDGLSISDRFRSSKRGEPSVE